MTQYTDDMNSISEEQLRGGFFAGWPAAPSPEQHLAVLRGSYRAIVAVDEGNGQVVGFVNMISDGVLTAFVPWLEVLPAHQSKGIGAELMRRILDGRERFYSVDLMCDEPLQPYYKRMGMSPLTGMGLRNRAALSGHSVSDLNM
ncbi:GNAT family N-acetyltransferase [Nonomuraea africana]|uniref:GNAT superfamily N-acetyltransferase n=1 Tax=Nonomuraea africana TaxID=46171 RepID=A0ABR9KRN3_9ACTN|nr:GNAT family N-acetyltransferase [Nonomuraea africana]MBE1564669.1 GNAT superfamily N-acetyltransferase [Nonomuraea africana]